MTTETMTIQLGSYYVTIDPDHPDLPYKPPLHLLPILAKAYKKAAQNSKSAQRQLEQWARENPGMPQFKHILSIHYSITGEREKSVRIARELAQEHPGFVQARTSLASAALSADEPGQLPELLGPQLDLAALYPERTVFHYNEYSAFYRVLVGYYCQVEEVKTARAILSDLKTVADRLGVDDDFKLEESMVMLAQLPRQKRGLFPADGSEPSERTNPTLPQTDEAPRFRLPQTALLYHHGFHSLPDEVARELLAADHEQLRLDLEDVVRDAIRRYNYFSDLDYSFDSHSAPLHALYLLMETRSTESLPVVLELFRQPAEVLDFWFEDLLCDETWPVLYTLGLNQIDQLVAYLKEPLNHTYARVEVFTTLQQVALHHPERRAEVLALFKELLAFYLDHANDDTIMNNTVLSFLISDLAEMKAKELLPEIEAVLKTDFVDYFVVSGIEEVNAEMNSPEDRKRPLKNYFETKEYLAGLEERMMKQELRKGNDTFSGNWQEEQEEDYIDWEDAGEQPEDFFHDGHDPYVRQQPKTGRNDPCPCGSGKKYKHCHGKC